VTTSLITYFPAQGPLADGFKVRPCSITVPKEILLMAHLTSSQTAQIWAERIALCERSNAPVAQFCLSINCSPTSFYQWKRKLAAKPQTSAFLRVSTSEPTKDSIEIKLPSGISILVPVSAVESISAILEQVA